MSDDGSSPSLGRSSRMCTRAEKCEKGFVQSGAMMRVASPRLSLRDDHYHCEILSVVVCSNSNVQVSLSLSAFCLTIFFPRLPTQRDGRQAR